MEVSISYYFLGVLLFIVGVVAGTIDAISGGGGLISLPILMACGLPPQVALGTNKLQTTIGTSIATYTYYRQGLLSFKILLKGLSFGIMGAILGAITTQWITGEALEKIIPFLLLIMLIYTLLLPKFGIEVKQAKIKESHFYIIFGFILGFYDGFLGPGTGSLWVFCMIFFIGYTLTAATAYAKVFNLKSNIIATICFIIGGNINYSLAACMAAGQLIGGQLGARMVIKKGDLLVRKFFISIVSLSFMVLFYKTYPSLVKKLIVAVNEYPIIFIMMLIIIIGLMRFLSSRSVK